MYDMLSAVQLGEAYRAALRHGVPAHLQTGDFWDAIEIKTALALLRAVVYPAAASEGIKRRIVRANQEVKMPVTAGFGEDQISCTASHVMWRWCWHREGAAAGALDVITAGSGAQPPLGRCMSELACTLAVDVNCRRDISEGA